MRRYVVAVAPAALATVVLLLAGGCGGPTDRGDPPEAVPEETVTKSSPEPDDGRGRRAATRRDTVTDAVADLARRLGVATSQVTVVSAEEVTWRDGSLGCPQPGMSYPQVLTDGSRVVLEAGGRRYEYHAGGRRAAFLCQDPEPPAGR